MSKKIFFTDLDGTLLTTDKKITKECSDAIERLLAEGNYFVACTGRSIEGGKIVTKALNLKRPGCYMINFQGATIYDCYEDKVIFEEAIDEDHLIDVMTSLEEHGIYAQTYTGECICTLHDDERLEYYNCVTHEKVRILNSLEELRGFNHPKVVSIAIDDPDTLVSFQTEYASKEGDYLDSFFSCKDFLEYCKKDVNKGTGLIRLCNMLDIPIENSVAIGDERNDISMIKAAKVGVAVKNAHEETIKAADYVTLNDNNNSAVAEAINKYILNI